ncbi:hypothetical protein EDF31_106215 [Curtobacterium sp. PhB142]|uniref:hypothetical protein n=1 Tax=unclassified Curtobacterium TaxID=257496 RepID=UPI001044FBCE|nr:MULTISPECIES: hypothetical protein [unclassified Curtobacterium]TCL84222.1 hypothetical protein EDF31_106215 [Curtobacterium sp. PhB142]TCM01485.1 hypothetical protein EDF26_106214 [Curtobacterium sp. PhB134]
MTPFTARCVLVGTAVVLVLAGVFAPLDGASRAVVFAASGCCAVLDVLLHRSGAAGPREPESLAGDYSAAAIESQCPSAPGRLLLGHGPDGDPWETDTTGHVVVVGTGALAAAVFRAIAEQLRATADPGYDLRAAGRPGSPAGDGPALPDGATLPDDPALPDGATLPDGTAVLARLDRSGRPSGTVVLVPGLGAMPRLWDDAVEVTRYGCTVRRPPDRHGVTLRPVLPVLPVRPELVG